MPGPGRAAARPEGMESGKERSLGAEEERVPDLVLRALRRTVRVRPGCRPFRRARQQRAILPPGAPECRTG